VCLFVVLVVSFLGSGQVQARPINGSSTIREATTSGPNDSGNRSFNPGWTNVTSDMEGQRGKVRPTYAAAGAAAAFDPSVGAMVVYGGVAENGSLLALTWVFVAGEYEWDPLVNLGTTAGPTVPPALTSSSIAVGANGDLILYGGTLANGSAYNGTWEFGGNTWMNLTWTPVPLNGSSPPAAGHPELAEEGPGAGTLLYTGASRNSTWVLNAGTWSPAGGAAEPPARTRTVMTFDGGRGGDVLFGGQSPTANAPNLNDTWVFRDGSWNELTTPVAPPPLSGDAFAYDSADGYDLLVGTHGTFQTWELSASGWSNVTASGAGAPVPRLGPILVYESWDEWVLLGGGTAPGTGLPVGDFWGWDFPASLTYSGLTTSSLPLETWGIVALVVAVPIVVAYFYYRRPRRKLPSDVPAPSSSPSRG
jgi:hypothetical protein